MPALQKAGLEIVFNQEYPADIKDMTGLLTGAEAATSDAGRRVWHTRAI